MFKRGENASGGGTELMDPGYYCDASQIKALSNNVAASPSAAYGACILANITDLGYTKVTCSSTNSGYNYRPFYWTSEGVTGHCTDTAGTGSRVFNFPSNTAYILIHSASSGSGMILTATFS